MQSKKNICQSWKLYAITCPEQLGTRRLEEVAEEVILGGVGAIQLRDKSASDQDLADQARRLLAVTRRYRIPLIINDRLEVAKRVGVDGYHMGQGDGALAHAMAQLGDQLIYGRSTHSPEHLAAAIAEGFDYVGVGPVYATPTKPGKQAVGLEYVRHASKVSTIPFVAIGGIDRSNVGDVRSAGARCVAVVRSLMGHNTPRTEAEFYVNCMKGPINGK